MSPRLAAALAVAAVLLEPPAAVHAAPCYDAISLGGFHGLVSGNSTTRAFGENAAGQCDVPPALAGRITAAAAGGFFSCARASGGAASVMCWGGSGSGVTYVPAAVAADAGVQGLYAGGYHACAVLSNGSLACWGANGAGQVGPLPAAASGGPVLRAALGVYHGCLLAGGSLQAVACWGKDDAGQVSGLPAALAAAGGAGAGVGLACGGHHSCAWGANFRTCWGSDSSGQSTVPASVPSSVDALCAGGYFSCSLAGGSVGCWGSNAEGETSVPPSASDGNITAIACGWYGACGLKADGSFVCWGGSLAGAAASAVGSVSLDLSTAAVSGAGATSGSVYVSSGASNGAGGSTGTLSLVSGDASGGVGSASGAVVVATGAAPSGGTRGAISLLASRVEAPGALSAGSVEAATLAASTLSASNVTARNLTVGSTSLSEADLIGLLAMLRSGGSGGGGGCGSCGGGAYASISPSPSASPTTSASPSVSTVIDAPYMVSTLAGCGSGGYVDGISTAATFNGLVGVAVDSSGVLYAADAWNHVIRRVEPNGTVSTLAGRGSAGYVNDQGTLAAFNSPQGVALDTSGIVYVADSYNHVIRKVATDGTVSTLAGRGTAGYVEGQGTGAAFKYPTNVAVGASGVVYVSDQNYVIRKITPDGTVSTLAGAVPVVHQTTPTTFSYLHGLAVDSSGVVYVADTGYNRIRKVTPGGSVSTFAGTGSYGYADGLGTAAAFSNPYGIFVDASGTVYVADGGNSRIRAISPDGTVSTLAGTGVPGYADGINTTAAFSGPQDVTLDASGVLFVADAGNNAIRKVSANGTVSTLAGSCSAAYLDAQGTAAAFRDPWGVAVDASGYVYVADAGNNRIRKISPGSGDVTTLVGAGGTSLAFYQPTSLAVDASGVVYVADASNHRIRKIAPTGTVSTLAGSGTAGYADGQGPAATFNLPQGVAVHASGTVYVADTVNHRIRKVSSGGLVTTVAGSGTASYADALGTAAAFNNPTSVAVDASGILYVADTSNHRIRKIAPDGTVNTLAGNGTQGYGDGQGASVAFNAPVGVAVDAWGVVYVADRNNNRIRKVAPDGTVSTLAGNGTQGYSDALGTAAAFNSPTGVAVGAPGVLYVVDNAGRRVRKLSKLL